MFDYAIVFGRLFGAIQAGCTRRMDEMADSLHRIPNRWRDPVQAMLTRRLSMRMLAVGDRIAIRLFGSWVVDNRLLNSVRHDWFAYVGVCGM